EALRTEHAGVDRMIGVAADADRAPVLHADEHPAADRTVSARRRHPAIGNAFRRGVPRDGIVGVGIPVGEDVESEDALEVHAASLSRYGATRCFGTTLTKKRYRPIVSAASAVTSASHSASGCDVKSGRPIAPTASSTPLAMNNRRKVVVSSIDDALASIVPAFMLKNFRARTTNCPPAASAEATASHRGAPAPVAAANSGPSVNAVRLNCTSVSGVFQTGLDGTR